MNPPGSRKDRHALIGQGTIGEEAIVQVLVHPALEGLPFLLETPTDDAGHGEEIKRLRERLGLV
jgi:deoxyribonuclease-4